MRDTWYVLEDGVIADPAEVTTGEDGVLRHSSGIAVAYCNGVPRSRGVDPQEERTKAKPKEMRPEEPATKPEGGKRGYKTREAKGS